MVLKLEALSTRILLEDHLVILLVNKVTHEWEPYDFEILRGQQEGRELNLLQKVLICVAVDV